MRSRVLPPSLRDLCVARFLVEARLLDEASRREVVAVLLEVVGLERIVAAAASSPAAFAGLHYLPASGDLSLTDDCRRYLATNGKALAAAFFRNLADAAKVTDLTIGQCDAVVAVAKAFVGNDRFRRDMTGQLLPKPAADACRSLRKVAQARADDLAAKGASSSSSRRPQQYRRFQDLRHHTTTLNSARYSLPGTWVAPRNPHFPGYDH